MLATFYGLESRTQWLTGHVVADLKYQGSWHIYDPYTLGIVYYDGQVAGMGEMVLLARQGRLEKDNEKYRTTEDNRVGPYYPPLSVPFFDPYMAFFPGERRVFYEGIFMLTTDGHYLKDLRDKARDEPYTPYHGIMANYIREIPINEKTAPSGVMVVEDYFPTAGVFIRLPDHQRELKPESFPVISIDSDLKGGGWISAREYEGMGHLKGRYLNLTQGIKNLERHPSQAVKIDRLDGLMSQVKGLKLLMVHTYCYKNAQFREDALDALQESGLSIDVR
jgi:hypothetical protein